MGRKWSVVGARPRAVWDSAVRSGKPAVPRSAHLTGLLQFYFPAVFIENLVFPCSGLRGPFA